MEEFAQQLKCNGVDLAWWPLFLGSFQREAIARPRVGMDSRRGSLEDCLKDLTHVVVASDCPDFEETLP